MKKPVIWMVCFLLGLCLVTCKNKEENPHGNELGAIDAQSDPIKVSGKLSVFGDFPLELVSNGKLVAQKKAFLNFKITGVLKNIHFKNGQRVQEGQLIAELENSMEKLDLEQAKLRLERARIDRLDKIVSHKVGAKNPEDVSEEALKRFNMEVGYNEAVLSAEQAEIKYNYTKLIAPFSGRIANLETKPNNSPKSGEPFCILMDDSRFEVIFPVMESEISRLATGQEITLKPFFLDSVYYPGVISEINPLIDEHGMVKVKAIVNDKNKRLIEGMNVKVFVRDKVPGCLIVPKEAVVLRNNKQVVFSLFNDTLAKWNYVFTELENSQSYSIKEGLTPGDTVITIGNVHLAHHARVDFELIEEEK